MEARRFDTVMKTFGRGATRRRVLGGLLGGVGGAALLGTSLDTIAKARANRKEPHRAKRHRRGSVHGQTKPQVIGPVHDEGIAELFECTEFGFTVLDDFNMDFTLRWFTDKDGNRVKGVEQVSGTDTFTNSETGKAIAAPYHNSVLIDPEVGLGAIAGVIFKVIVPGAGAVFLDVGRIVTNQAGDIITFQAGPHQFFDGDVDALCAALA